MKDDYAFNFDDEEGKLIWFEKYLIMEVGFISNDIMDFIHVEANPVHVTKINGRILSQLVEERKGRETQHFLFDDSDGFYDILSNLCLGHNIWTPCRNDFEDSVIEINGEIIMMHQHISSFGLACSDKSLNSGNDVHLIPEIGDKIRELYLQYYRNGWYDSYSGYEFAWTMPDGNPDFFQWLFGDFTLNGMSLDQLDNIHFAEFKRFCSEFDRAIHENQ